MKNALSIIMILILSMFLAGCDKDIEFVNTTPDNNGTKVLKADAGENKKVKVGDSIEIVGSFTVGRGEIVGYEWKEGSVLLSGLKKVDYTSSKVGLHTLTFTVYDSNDKNSSDTMIITVNKEVNASK